MSSLSVVIITFNEAHNIERCLNSVRQVADEIIILDSFSTDDTVALASKMGVVVKQQQFLGYIQQKNAALELASNNYVLCLDADEALDEALVQSILSVKENFTATAYHFNRCTSYCGRFIRNGSWYPDKKIRLFDKRHAQWGGINPHDKVELTVKNEVVQYLKGDMLHFSYYTIEEHLARINHYTTISAAALYAKGVRSNWAKILINPLWRFIYGYFIRLGFLDGFYGFVIAINCSHETFQKYIKLYQLQQ
ncbi:glycosyltransferase family 2 protein [Ferruginibacter paludis]|uniref:glycosyltransferase family 2 protein n=1 Tax=Ferruginibacter paludis TaxID=1310417 RepID=UPI0025B5B9A4|nr:glycosyltransferase family 2 protein [Ferruginibacter paludis]MDN3654401.1 glycosyltransferase family 2 protein [Ferruginibacter paludis]